MGLDAVVACNCLLKGVARPAPVPVHIDEDGWLAPVDDADRTTFESWRRDCCAHPDREHTSCRIGNWSMFRSFQEALEESGVSRFPTLSRVLPDGNGGQVSPVDARACLAELAVFRRDYRHERPVLVDADTGEILREHIASNDGVFALLGSEGIDLGFDADGLFVVPRGTRAVIFQARRVELRPDAGGGRELVDLDSGASHVTTKPLALDTFAGRARLEVRQSVRTAADHAHVLGALEQVFRASIENGNPVIWC
jgi:hypothetical protein